MRVIDYESEEEREMESSSSSRELGLGFHNNLMMKVIIVGYALTSKKIKSFLQPKLEGLARYIIIFINSMYFLFILNYNHSM